jgi:hypothetical protein
MTEMKALILCLESKLLEEITTALCLLFTGNLLLVHVTIQENLLQLLLDIHLSLCVYQICLINRLFQVQINNVTCWEDVTNIDVLDKGLHGFRSLLDLLLGHGSCHLSWVLGQTGDEAVRKLFLAISIIEGLHYNSLLSSMSSCKDNNNFSGLCGWKKTKRSL